MLPVTEVSCRGGFRSTDLHGVHTCQQRPCHWCLSHVCPTCPLCQGSAWKGRGDTPARLGLRLDTTETCFLIALFSLSSLSSYPRHTRCFQIQRKGTFMTREESKPLRRVARAAPASRRPWTSSTCSLAAEGAWRERGEVSALKDTSELCGFQSSGIGTRTDPATLGGYNGHSSLLVWYPGHPACLSACPLLSGKENGHTCQIPQVSQGDICGTPSHTPSFLRLRPGPLGSVPGCAVCAAWPHFLSLLRCTPLCLNIIVKEPPCLSAECIKMSWGTWP